MSQFAVECEAQLLKYAGPFRAFGATESARAWGAKYLAEKIEAEGVAASREAHCANPAVRKQFFDRLAMAGAHACRLGLERQARGCLVGGQELRLTLSDVRAAARIVELSSISLLCEP